MRTTVVRVPRARRDEILAAAILVEIRIDGRGVAARFALATGCAKIGLMERIASTGVVYVTRRTLARAVRVFCACLALPRVVRALVLETCRAAVVVNAVALLETMISRIWYSRFRFRWHTLKNVELQKLEQPAGRKLPKSGACPRSQLTRS
jgi:hypothetical protein